MVTENVAWINDIYCLFCDQHEQSCKNLLFTNVGTVLRFAIGFFAYVLCVCVNSAFEVVIKTKNAWSDAVV